ncbi:NAD(P)/FAD-dependent oxidoreductase [Rhodopirellula sp. MGV]|uniref:NAD(P)/FAD-dependent oxidoreductase n=1 Tax=Rhodopirellula sp. MGV TaxID=2023130 RepID=UPI0018EA264D|nr:tryptophan 7-halogenase [Rhodopirellula sp. MGV]
MSTYDGWQQRFPKLACGLKRGFSYFDHRPVNTTRRESVLGERSLLVAASPSDESSDTHWYRKDVDMYHFGMAAEAGVDCLESVQVIDFHSEDTNGPATVTLNNGTKATGEFVVDASGAGTVTARFAKQSAITEQLTTRTCATFAHYDNVQPFTTEFNSIHSDQRASVPFDSDNAAQHHLIDGGWVWMLRMNNGITSVGVTLSAGLTHESEQEARRKCYELLDQRLDAYPSLHHILKYAQRVEPCDDMICLPRLQRLYDPVISQNCVMTPTTAAMIDPLHSTGIAHALSGVHRIAELILGQKAHDAESLEQYRSSVVEEAKLIDQLVNIAYGSMRSFRRFTAATMIYFAAAINCEEAIIDGEVPDYLWMCGDTEFRNVVNQCQSLLFGDQPDDVVIDSIRSLIQPFNHVGLMDDTLHNRYAYTATKTSL